MLRDDSNSNTASANHLNIMPKKTNKKKSTKAKELKQTHAMIEKETFVPTTLDQIWGDSGEQKYKTLDPEEYKNWLDEQDKASLQTHATSVGLLPVEHVGELKKRLVREFNVHRAKFTKPSSSSNELPKLEKDVKDILNEGR